ncbi:MAG: class I SAM-dependent methyltransferase [Cyanobacteria bacterium HKST-UBA03]|nr:class I SAM-dependent methyltransferase [Cyanobacteria bacterium HKST-UBA03]
MIRFDVSYTPSGHAPIGYWLNTSTQATRQNRFAGGWPPETSLQLDTLVRAGERAYHGHDDGAPFLKETLCRAEQEGRLKPGDKILELGPFTGRNLLNLAKSFPQYRFFGIDQSRPLVAHLNQAIQAAGLKNVQVVRGDIRHGLPRPWYKHRFKAIMAGDWMMGYLKPKEAERSIQTLTRRHLAPEGLFIMSLLADRPNDTPQTTALTTEHDRFNQLRQKVGQFFGSLVGRREAEHRFGVLGLPGALDQLTSQDARLLAEQQMHLWFEGNEDRYRISQAQRLAWDCSLGQSTFSQATLNRAFSGCQLLDDWSRPYHEQEQRIGDPQLADRLHWQVYQRATT